MITLKLNAMEVRDLASLCEAKAKRVTGDRGYWTRLARDLNEYLRDEQKKLAAQDKKWSVG